MWTQIVYIDIYILTDGFPQMNEHNVDAEFTLRPNLFTE